MRQLRAIALVASVLTLSLSATYAVYAPPARAASAPLACVSREQFVLDLDQAAGIQPLFPTSPNFTDVPASSPYYGYIEAAYHRGFISGYPNGTFQPLGCLTRADVAKIEVIALGEQSAAAQHQGQATTFADNASLPAWALQYIWEAQALDLIQGFPNNTFQPNDIVTAGDEQAFISHFKAHLASLSPAPTVASVQPQPLYTSATPQGLTIAGTGFQPGDTVQVERLAYLDQLSPSLAQLEPSSPLAGVSVTVLGSTQIDVSLPPVSIAACYAVTVTSGGATSNAFNFAVENKPIEPTLQPTGNSGNALVDAAEAAYSQRCNQFAGGQNYIASLGGAFQRVAASYVTPSVDDATIDPIQSMAMLQSRPGEGGQCQFFVDLLLQESGVYPQVLNYTAVEEASGVDPLTGQPTAPYGPLAPYYVPTMSDIQPGDVLITKVAAWGSPHTAIVVGVSGQQVTMIDSNFVGTEMIGEHTMTVGSPQWNGFDFGLLRFSQTGSETASGPQIFQATAAASGSGLQLTLDGANFQQGDALTVYAAGVAYNLPAADVTVVRAGEIQAPFIGPNSGSLTVQVTAPGQPSSNIASLNLGQAAPTGLSSAYLSGTAACVSGVPAINLSWTPVSGSSGYVLQRTPAWPGGSATLAVPTGWLTFSNDAGLVPGQSYTYTVVAQGYGVTGPPSNAFTVTTPTTCAAPPQTGLGSATLTALAACSGATPAINLSWTAVPGAIGYELLRTPLWPNGSATFAIPTGWLTFSNDAELVPGQSYTYSVVAQGYAVSGPPSNAVTVAAPAGCASSAP